MTTDTNQEPLIEIHDVKKVYTMRGGSVHALRGVSFNIYPGEYISIMGPSGSGKSTLFNMIGGLDMPTDGTISVNNVSLAELNSRALAWFRCCRIGYIFQTFNLIPTLTALENVMLPSVFHMNDDETCRRKATECLESVGLGDRLTHRPNELSGGQMQRVAIARSLVNDPQIILADEPTGNLDLKTGEQIIDLLARLNSDRGVTVVTVTHDHKMLSRSDRIVWFESGSIERIEKKDDVQIKVGSIEE